MTITLDRVTKAYGKWSSQETALDRISVVFQPRSRYVILGQQGSGKSTLLRLISGMQRPSSGTIVRAGTVAPPGGSQAALTFGKTVRGVISFCAAYYRVDFADLMRFVLEFSELQDDADTSIATLLSAERTALSYAIAYGIPADFYLVDGSIAHGSETVRRRCRAAFEERRANAATIIATRNARAATELGDHFGILHEGKLEMYDDMQAALDTYAAIELDERNGTLSAAEVMVRQGDLVGALGYLTEYAALNRDDIPGHKMLANVALRSQNYAVAQNALQTLVELQPDDSGAYLALARASERGEDWTTAATALGQYLQLEPGDQTARTSLARCYERGGQAQAATKLWHRIFLDSSTLPEATVAIRSCIRLKDWNAAFRMLDDALDRWPTDVPLLTMAAQTNLQLGRPQDFVTTILHMVDVDPGKAVMLASRSLTQLEAQDVIMLLTRVREVGHLDQVDGDTMRRFTGWLDRLGRTAARAGRTEEAEEIQAHADAFRVPEKAETTENA